MNLSKIKLAGGGERAQYLVHEFNDNTIRFVVNYPGVINPEILCAATKAVVESVDVLHGTFFSDSISAYWHINDNLDPIDYFQYIETEGSPELTANSLSLSPIRPDDKAQLRCFLVQNNEASSIVLNISHLCVDGSDGKYLLSKLVEAYNLILKEGSADSLQVKDGSRAPEKVYEKLSIKDLKELLSNPLSSVETPYPFANDNPGMPQLIHTIITSEIMSKARAKAKLVNATANDILVTAGYHAYASLSQVNPINAMSVTSMIDLRRHCVNGESEGLCNMSGALPTTLENGVFGTFEETLLEVSKQTKEVKENPLAGLEGMPILHGLTRTLPIGLLLMAVGKIYGSMSFGITNLGNLKCDELALGDLVPNGGIFGGPLKKKPGMQVSVISFDGECVLSVVGQYTKEDNEIIQSTLDAMKKEIEKYAEKE